MRSTLFHRFRLPGMGPATLLDKLPRLTLLQRYSLANAALTLVIAGFLGIIVPSILQDSALQRVRVVTDEAQALFSAEVRPGELAHPLSSAQQRTLDRLSRTVLATNQIVLLRLWNRAGALLYSSLPPAPGDLPSSRDLLISALGGHTLRAISTLPDPSRSPALPAGRLLRVVVPAVVDGQIAGAYELDASLRVLDEQVSSTCHTIWVLLALGFSILYLAFHILVQRASRRLVRQNEENQRLLHEVNERARDTRMLYNVGQKLNAEDNLQAVLEQTLHAATDIFGFPNVAILLVDEHDKYLHHTAGRGYLAASLPNGRVAVGQGVIGRAAQERRATYVPDVRQDAGTRPLVSQTVSQLALPLIVAHQVIGVLNVESTVREAFVGRDLQLLAALADQVARAVRNALLLREREEAQLASLDSMAAAIDARDKYTAGHSRRVRDYALDLATQLGYAAEDRLLLDRAARLHDVGKIGIADAILTKPSRLTEAERADMQRHPVIGCNLLQPVGFLAPALPMIRHHHECWDGSGYPDGLQGTEIPLGARVIAVADTLDAMTSSRPYRAKLPMPRACEEIVRGSGTQFDPTVTAALLRAVAGGHLELRPSTEFPFPG